MKTIQETATGKDLIIENLYSEYCRESFDQNGTLTAFEPSYPGSFNFAYDVVDRIAGIQPNRRAMVWVSEEGGERIFTFADIKRYSDKTANMLREHGVKKGDMVMLVLRRHYQFWFSILALHKLGAIAINSTDMLTKKDYSYRFKAAGIKYIIATAEGETACHVDEACGDYSGVAAKFLVSASDKASDSREGWIPFNEAVESSNDELERVPTSAHDPLLLYFTSGTTGNPKMAMHDHTYPLGHVISAKYWHGITGSDLHLTVADTGWAKASWGKIYGQWFMGASLFVYDFAKFDPMSLMAAVSKYKVTTFCAPATIYRFFIKEGMGQYDLSNIRHATTAGEALNAEVFNRFYELTGLKIQEAFGQTETTAVTVNLLGSDVRPGSMGKPSPLYGVTVVDENGNPVPTGEVGELCVKASPEDHQVGLFRGYYRDESLTREAWHDGLYHTGDTAWMDEDGYLWYVGRVDDVIKASGYRIGPFEIESVLMEHPSVRECAVTGVSDPVRGTVVKATVILAGGSRGSEALKKELQEYVKAQTAPYKYPRIIDFVDELPKTFSGKIKRADIRKKDEASNGADRVGA
jgi:acetyl-CoA synthetase